METAACAVRASGVSPVLWSTPAISYLLMPAPGVRDRFRPPPVPHAPPGAATQYGPGPDSPRMADAVPSGWFERP